jgi:hypothetical protein
MPDGTETIPSTETDGTATPAAPATQPTTPVITPEIQALIDAEKQKAHDAGAAAARRALEGKSQKPQEPAKQAPPAAPGATGLSMQEVQSMMAQQSAFDRAVGKAGISDEAVGVLAALRSVENPADVSAWVAQKARLFATAPAAAGQPTTPNNTPTLKPVPPANGVAPAPMSTVPTDAPDNVMGWSQDQVDSYVAKHYPVPNMPWHPKNAAARRTLAQKVQAQMVGRSIVLGVPTR